MAPPRKYTDSEKDRAVALRQAGRSLAEVQQETGIPTGTVSNWVRERGARGQPPPAAGAGAVLLTPPDETGDGAEAPPGRKAELPPTRPPEGKIQTVDLNYREIADYIESFYKLAGQVASQGDEALAIALDNHAEKAGQAWANWIRSEPKVAAMLQKLMIGTPMGEVIGVHISIALAYFLSRGAIRAAAAERERIESSEDGAAAAAAAG